MKNYLFVQEKEVRPDNRELGEFRPTVLNIGGSMLELDR